MTIELLYLLLLLVLFLVLYQDIKNRTIHFVLPLTVFIISIIINIFSANLNWNMILFNIGFVAINIFGLILYFSLKEKQFINPIDTMLGLGDIVFFIALSPLFNLKSYIGFFISSLMFSLLLHLILNKVKHSKTIPLAGYMSLFLIGSLLCNIIFKTTLFA